MKNIFFDLNKRKVEILSLALSRLNSQIWHNEAPELLEEVLDPNFKQELNELHYLVELLEKEYRTWWGIELLKCDLGLETDDPHSLAQGTLEQFKTLYKLPSSATNADIIEAVIESFSGDISADDVEIVSAGDNYLMRFTEQGDL